MQQCVTLSSTEAEYVACSQCVTEMEFVRQLLRSMGVYVILPMIVYVDNTGAIELARNRSTTGRTKHIDVRYHYVREYIEDGIVKIVFVRSGDNDADVFTKNTGTETHNKHIDKFSEETEATPTNKRGGC